MRATGLTLLALVPAAFFAGTAVNVGHSRPQQQPAPPSVYVVDYMKVPVGGAAAYEALERDIWKKIHQERIRQGLSSSWALYRVRYPYGTSNEYDYVTVNTYRTLEDLDRSFSRELITKAVPATPIEQISSRTAAARQLVKGEVWIAIDRLP